MSVLSESTALRLYYSVATHNAPAPAPTTASGENEANERANTLDAALRTVESSTSDSRMCRICRWNRSDMQIVHCPCQCKGSVGYVHLQCLRHWILHRRDPHCEICHSHFNLPDEKINVRRMCQSFMCARCCGNIVKQLLFSASIIPLAHIILQQVLVCMEKINQSPHDQLTVREVLMASCALLTSSALFFHFFEFITMRFIMVRSILRQWWMFGNSNDFEIIDLSSDSQDIF